MTKQPLDKVLAEITDVKPWTSLLKRQISSQFQSSELSPVQLYLKHKSQIVRRKQNTPKMTSNTSVGEK